MTTKIKIQYVPASLPQEYEKNPRRLTTKQEKDLTESMKRFGFANPLILNSHAGRENIIIGGHQRLKVAKKLGFKEVPVVYLDLTPEKEKELLIRLNKNTGEWDEDLLKEFDADFLLDSGFGQDDLSEIFSDDLETEDDEFDEEKELKKIKKTNIKAGDLYQLGNHRLICGDSTDKNVVAKLMKGKLVDTVLTDPPYNINVDYNKGIGGKSNYGGKVDDNKSDEEYKKMITDTITNALEFSKKDCHFFYYCDQKYVGMLQNIYESLGINYKRTCLWIKNGMSPTPKVAFNKNYEPCVYGTRGKPYLSKIMNLDEIMNKEIGTGNQSIDDILDMIDLWLVKRIPGQEYSHPTQKPITLHERAIKRCTKQKDIILDLFGGSGSELLACEQTNRYCYTVEKDPIFCQLIINRYEKYSGHKAKKISV